MADDYYQVLGVGRSADPDEIQRAYRGLARRFHPDINKDPGAEERFKEINEAYAVLSDPRQRERYDRFGADWRRVPEDFAAGGPPPAGRSSYRNGFDASDVDIEDLLGGLFGGGFRRGGGVSAPGADAEAELVLPVDEAYSGGRRRITLQTAAGPRGYDVTIPAGVTDGQRIRLAGQGGVGLGDGPRGDLYLVVRLAPHPRYRVDGRDIAVDLPVAPWEAALGADVPVETPGGSVRVRVPAGSSSGRRLRLRGRGLPNPRGTAGDLFAEVRIVVPAAVSEAEKELLERLARASTFDARRDGGR